MYSDKRVWVLLVKVEKNEEDWEFAGVYESKELLISVVDEMETEAKNGGWELRFRYSEESVYEKE